MSPGLENVRLALVGGAGFIGHHLALEAKCSGADVHIVDHLVRGNGSALYAWFLSKRLELLNQAGIPIHSVDARDTENLSLCLEQVKPDAIVHLAAIASAAITNRDPVGALDHGLKTLANTLEYARRRRCRFVFISSSMVYGDFKNDSATEEDACEPVGLYGVLKLSGEQLVTSYARTFDLPCTIARPSAVYGERCIARRVSQIFVENALLGKMLTLKGDGTDSLDFTYVRDLVQGLKLCLTRSEAIGQTFNITFGSARSMNQLIAILKEYFTEVEVRCEPQDGLLPKRGTLSVEKARRLLGYAPSFPLEKGFPLYIESYLDLARRRPELFYGPSSMTCAATGAA